MKKLIFVSAILVSTAGFAQTGTTNTKADQQNQQVCRVIAETGSRLSRSRVCMTRLEWEQRQRDMRETVERGQRVQVNPVG